MFRLIVLRSSCSLLAMCQIAYANIFLFWKDYLLNFASEEDPLVLWRCFIVFFLKSKLGITTTETLFKMMIIFKSPLSYSNGKLRSWRATWKVLVQGTMSVLTRSKFEMDWKMEIKTNPKLDEAGSPAELRGISRSHGSVGVILLRLNAGLIPFLGVIGEFL